MFLNENALKKERRYLEEKKLRGICQSWTRFSKGHDLKFMTIAA